MNVLPSLTNEYLFLNPPWIVLLSYCHDLLVTSVWHALVRHHIGPHPLLIKNNTNTYLVTLTSPQWFSQYNLYALGCVVVGRLSFSTNLVLATLVQLPPLIITQQTLSLICHLVWKMLSHCISSSSFTYTLKAHLVTSNLPLAGYSIISSSLSSSKGGISSSSLSTLDSIFPSSLNHSSLIKTLKSYVSSSQTFKAFDVTIFPLESLKLSLILTISTIFMLSNVGLRL